MSTVAILPLIFELPHTLILMLYHIKVAMIITTAVKINSS